MPGDEENRKSVFPLPARRAWKVAGGRELSLGSRPLVMGILNVTPDSFSDGGLYLDREKAVAHGLEMAREGADIIDVGGESTRPGAERVPEEEEISRTTPVIAELTEKADVPLSIDTTRASVARAALDAGAAIINDISGFTFDPAMADLAVESGAGLVVMHIRGTPKTMQRNPCYGDVVAEVSREIEERVARLLHRGADPASIVVDPGIGFGKTYADNLRLLARLDRIADLGYPLLVGCSRKSFLRAISGRDVGDCIFETLAADVAAALAGARIIRVHDVEENRRALAVVEAIYRAAAVQDSTGS